MSEAWDLKIELIRHAAHRDFAEDLALHDAHAAVDPAFEWSLFIEQVSDDIELHVFRISDGAGYLGAAVLYVCGSTDLAPYLPAPVAHTGALMQRIGIRPFGVRLGVVEIPLLNASGFRMKRQIEPETLRTVVLELAEMARRELRLDCIFFRSEETESEQHAFAACGLIGIPTYGEMRMQLTAADFDGHVAGLDRKVRSEIRRLSGVFAGCGGRMYVSDASGVPSSTLFDLFSRTVQRNSTRSLPLLIPVTEQFFSGLPDLSNPRPVHIVAEVEQRIVAFFTCLRWGEMLIPKFAGTDQDVSVRSAAYFNLYYETIRYAFSNNLRLIDMGATNEVLKKRLGCRLFPRAYWMKAYGPRVSALLGLMRRHVSAATGAG